MTLTTVRRDKQTKGVEPDGILSRPYRALTVGALALMSMSAFESIAVSTAMPAVAEALDGLSWYAPAFGGAMAAGIVAMVVSGGWNDRKGPAAPLNFGMLFFSLGLLVAGLAPQMWVLVLGRSVQGFGSGLMSVSLYVVVGHVYPAALRPKIFAAFAAAWVIPSMVGPAVAGALVDHVGWRWVFLSVPLLVVPAAALIRPALRTISIDGDGSLPDHRRTLWAVATAAAAVALHFGGQQRGLVAALILTVAVVALVVSAPRLLPVGTFRVRRGLPSVIVLRGLAAASMYGAEVFIPLLLVRERGLSTTAAGFALTAGALAWSGASWYLGRRPATAPRGRLLRTGMLLMLVALGFVALTVSDQVPVYLGMAGWALSGLGMGLIYPLMSTMTLELSKPEEQGVNSSALQLGESLFTTTMLALGGTLFAALLHHSSAAAYLTSFGISAVLATVGYFVAGRTE
jgi:MFS family permease